MVNGFWVYGCLNNAGGLWVEQKIIFFELSVEHYICESIMYGLYVGSEKEEREVINKKKPGENG